MLLSTLTHSRRFSARVTNVSTNTDLSDYIDSIDISMPRLSEISTMTAKFQTDEVMVAKGNEILIEALDEVGNTIYSLSGEATVTNVEHNYTGRSKYSYEVKEEYTRLFERVIAETEVFFDLYVCNNADKANSLMHIIGQKLGFKEFDFRDYLERVPFIVFNEGDRWIDELQSLISATGSIIYVFNKKLVFRPCNFNLNRLLLFNDRNIITNISRRFKGQNINGTKVLYDRFERLDNQVVFNLASKIIVDENTGLDKDVQSMRINYITSSVASPTITRANGYYFTTDSPDSRVDVALKSGSDYVIKEMKSTGLIVKFYNARPHKLYIDNFEIKGMPLVKYTDNSAVVKDSNVANEAEENFRKLNKNKYIQTLKQAENLCNAEYIRGKSEYTYEFDTQFIPDGLNLGEVYNLEIKGINTLIELESYSIHLKPSDFRIKVKGRQVELDVQVKQSNTDSLNLDTQFVDLKPLEEKIEDNTNAVKQVTQKVKSKLHVGETEPSANVEEYDVWLKESNNTFKIYLNGKWGSVVEKDLLPAIKHYNSLRKAELNIGKVNDRAGLFLMNNDEKFGAINGTLAEVSVDKKGTVKMGNVNNLLEWNVKDPSQPNKVRSKLYMGVTDVNKVPENVYFKIGDASNGFSLEFKDGEKGVAKIDGMELGGKLKSDKSEIDKEIQNLSKADGQLSAEIRNTKAEAKGYADSTKNEAIKESKQYTNTKKSEIDRNINNLSQMDAQLSNDIRTAKNEVKSYADTKKAEIENSLKSEITFEVGGDADKYYPVYITSRRKLSVLSIYRNYSEKAPNSWYNNSVTHHGGLNLQIQTRFGTNWDGNPTDLQVIKFSESYTNIASKIEMTVYGMFIWLRGGGAKYHAYTNVYETNTSLEAVVYLNGFRFSDLGGEYAKRYPNLFLAPGTYDETGRAESIKALMTYNRREIDRQFTNSDGKLTSLQQKYENTVKDVQNFKTETTANIGTVERALQEGNFVVTGNTVFDGNASFISRGNDERITINGGSIDFYRTVGGREQRLTRIKNIRYGTIQTDSKGKGIVDFEGFKQPMLIFPSVKSANFGKNMASIFCYAEHVEKTKYRFYVGGTNEDYREAKAIKNVGTTWSASNAVSTTLFGWTGSYYRNTKIAAQTVDKNQYKSGGPYNTIEQVPKIRVRIYRNSEILFQEDYTVSASASWDSNSNRFNRDINYSLSLNLSKSVNMFKKFSSRTNVTYKYEITILQPNFTIRYGKRNSYSVHHGSKSDGWTDIKYVYYKLHQTIVSLSPSSFSDLSITASAETSSISSATGYGEVGYIAMEVD